MCTLCQRAHGVHFCLGICLGIQWWLQAALMPYFVGLRVPDSTPVSAPLQIPAKATKISGTPAKAASGHHAVHSERPSSLSRHSRHHTTTRAALPGRRTGPNDQTGLPNSNSDSAQCTFKLQSRPIHPTTSDQINHTQHLHDQPPSIRQTLHAASNIVLIQAGIPFKRIPIPPHQR